MKQLIARAKFQPGQIVSTPAALEAMMRSGISSYILLARHLSGDWGDVDDEDKAASDWAMEAGLAIWSKYELPGGPAIMIKTEWDRSVTTLFLPGED